MREAFICEGWRTPIGRYGGALAHVRPDDMLAGVIRELVAPFDGLKIDECLIGCANQAGEDNRDVARMAVLLAGLPDSVPAATINRLCGSGLDAVGTAARAIMAGEYDVAIAGVDLLYSTDGGATWPGTIGLDLAHDGRLLWTWTGWRIRIAWSSPSCAVMSQTVSGNFWKITPASRRAISGSSSGSRPLAIWMKPSPKRSCSWSAIACCQPRQAACSSGSSSKPTPSPSKSMMPS